MNAVTDSIGITCFTLEDEAYLLSASAGRRACLKPSELRGWLTGDDVRDWTATPSCYVLFPYTQDLEPIEEKTTATLLHYMWPFRTPLGAGVLFGNKTKLDAGLSWYEFGRLTSNKLRTPLALPFACVATHNHFALDRGGHLFNRHAPIIKLPATTNEAEHLSLLGLLNGSCACFWMKQVCHNKGSTVDQAGARQRTTPFEDFFDHDCGKLKKFPIPAVRPKQKLAGWLDAIARKLSEQTASCILKVWGLDQDLEKLVVEAETKSRHHRGTMVRLQEDLDWECYLLYSLTDEDLADPNWETRELPVKLGERAFEIVLARKMRDEGLHTTWFDRHSSTPITELPKHWPADYRKLIERRIAAIESNPHIALIEQPEYKRRWNDTPWAEKVATALHDWLLDRLESYFDFDGRMNEEGKPSAQVEVCLLPLVKLADIAAKDQAFREVGRIYREGRIDFDVTKLVAELVEAESVPLLPILRYKPTGLDKRKAWERTWDLQRREDAIDAASHRQEHRDRSGRLDPAE